MPDRDGRHLRPGDRVRWTYKPDKAPAVVLHEVSDGYVLVTTDDGMRVELDGAELEWVADIKHTSRTARSKPVSVGGPDRRQLVR
jgi:hypothetical protein